MGGFGNWPNFDLWIQQTFGDNGYSCVGSLWLSGASNIVLGSNPPYSINNFFAFHPKFGGVGSGAPVAVVASLTQGSPNFSFAIPGTSNCPAPPNTICSPAPTIAVGQLVTGSGISDSTVIQTLSISNGEASGTLSQNATVTSSAAQMTIYWAPLAPIQVICAYITLASASLVQARWLDTWWLGMGLYVAHFLTLYLRSDGFANTPESAASRGLKQGITISASAGSVSQGIQPVGGQDDWGSWAQTSYGSLLIDQAKGIGAGPMWVL